MSLDLVICGGLVIDGTGGAPFLADIGVKNGRIAALGRVQGEAEVKLDATGLTVTPGFIDIHSHSDYTLLVDPRAVSALFQGVTLEVVGNCGFGCGPLGDATLAVGNIYGFNNAVPLSWHRLGEYLDRLSQAQPAVNVLTLVPNGQLRLCALGLTERPANSEGLAQMRKLLCESLDDGAFGFSTGLEYAAETGASEEEITTLCTEVSRRNALYATHTRKRDQGALEAIEEALRTARNAEVRLQISHLLPRSGANDGSRAIELVETARAEGLEVKFDMHTRLYGTTFLASLLPPWARKDGAKQVTARLHDPSLRESIKSFNSILSASGNWERVVLLDNDLFAEYSRLSLAEIGRLRHQDPHDAALDLLAQAGEAYARPMVILHCLSEAQQKECFAHPLCMPASDATTLAPDGALSASVFHGAYSWAAWFWRFMVHQSRALLPEDAIYRLTGLPARTLGLSDRGVLGVGAHADVAIFHSEDFCESATTFEPNKLARGMRHVLVNGRLAMRDGTLTGQRSGQVIRRT